MYPVVQNKQELVSRLLQNKEALSDYGVIKLGIFGSFVKNQVKPESDIDFFIELAAESKTLKNIVGLADFLQKILGRKVEIVTPASLNKHIGKYILAEVEYVSFAT